MNDITYIGITNSERARKKRFGIRTPDRRRHLYCIGKTGVGKTTLLQNLLIQDIQAGRGVALIDPHGDLAKVVLDFVPPERTNDVVYFDPTDASHPVGFNLLQQATLDKRPLIASHVLGAFKSVWSDSWGQRLEYILYNCLVALLSTPETTILGILRILRDAEYRARIIHRLDDPVVHAFWTEEFPSFSKSYRSEALGPIQNKVGQLLSSAPLRNILGQKRSSFSPRATMDQGKIFIANLAKGQIGSEKANLLGALLVASFQLAALERADTPEEDRRDFFLAIDEFHNFTTDAFAEILAESRKYRLCLTIAHQHLAQLPKDVRSAIFGNVGTLISFQVGAADGAYLAREFAELGAQDFANLERYAVYLRLAIDGAPSLPFSATTLPPIFSPRYNRHDIVIQQSRERFGTPRERIEREIKRMHVPLGHPRREQGGFEAV